LLFPQELSGETRIVLIFRVLWKPQRADGRRNQLYPAKLPGIGAAFSSMRIAPDW
jgi:hypothetical protein